MVGVIVIIGIAVVLIDQRSETTTRPSTDNSNVPQETTSEFIGTDQVSGHEYFIKDGDIQMKEANSDRWRLLTQTELVNDASISYDYTKILFTMKTLASDEIYSNGQGKNLKIFNQVNKLFALDIKSKEISDLDLIVDDWGWIPTKSDFYYEPVSLKEFYGDGKFHGDGILLRKSINDSNKQTLIQHITHTVNPYKFSPNGKYLAFITFEQDNSIKLNIINVNTLEVNNNNLDLVPLNGGLGGGAPLPIPNYYWDLGGEKLYTAFVPFLVTSEGIATEPLEVWRISASGAPAERLISGLKAYTTGSYDEYPKFSENFTQVIYRETENNVKNVNLDTIKKR